MRFASTSWGSLRRRAQVCRAWMRMRRRRFCRRNYDLRVVRGIWFMISTSLLLLFEQKRLWLSKSGLQSTHNTASIPSKKSEFLTSPLNTNPPQIPPPVVRPWTETPFSSQPPHPILTSPFPSLPSPYHSPTHQFPPFNSPFKSPLKPPLFPPLYAVFHNPTLCNADPTTDPVSVHTSCHQPYRKPKGRILNVASRGMMSARVTLLACTLDNVASGLVLMENKGGKGVKEGGK